MVHIRERFEPDALGIRQYNEKYRVYAQIYHTLKKLHDAM